MNKNVPIKSFKIERRQRLINSQQVSKTLSGYQVKPKEPEKEKYVSKLSSERKKQLLNSGTQNMFSMGPSNSIEGHATP